MDRYASRRYPTDVSFIEAAVSIFKPSGNAENQSFSLICNGLIRSRSDISPFPSLCIERCARGDSITVSTSDNISASSAMFMYTNLPFSTSELPAVSSSSVSGKSFAVRLLTSHDSEEMNEGCPCTNASHLSCMKHAQLKRLRRLISQSGMSQSLASRCRPNRCTNCTS